MADGRVLAFVAFAGLAIFLAWRWRQAHGVVPLAMGGYAILFAPTSNFALLIGTIMGERLAYAPSLCSTLLMGYGLWHLFGRAAYVRAGLFAVLALGWGGLTLARNQTWASAEAFYRSQALASPRSARAQFGLGKLHFDQGRLDSAMACYHQALAIFPSYPEAHYNLGLAYHRLGYLEAAEKAYRQALENNRGLAQAWYNLGLARQQQGDWQEAAHAYGQALALNPGDAAAWYNLGAALKQGQDWEGALRAFAQANALQPGQAAIWEETGEVHRALGHLPQALAAFEKALALEPGRAGLRRKVEALRRRQEPAAPETLRGLGNGLD
jgi:tetratricopeptide (TPR) repeat protein